MPAGEPPSRIDRVRAEQVRLLYANTPIAVSAGGASALLLLLGLVQVGAVASATGVALALVATVCVAFHLGLYGVYGHRRPAVQDWRPWRNLFVLACLAEGLTGTVSAFVLTSPDRLDLELLDLLVIVGCATSAIIFFGADLAAFSAYFIPAVAPHVLFGVLYRYPMHEVLGLMTGVFLVLMWVSAYRSNAQLANGLRLRFENADLLEEVDRQRALAEDASLAKSRFLASASHDLRQPLHALSLFVGALGLRRADRESRRLLGHVSQSVTAMEGLFGALLDISKLDAGATSVELQVFALAPLLERICVEFRAEAQAKGLRLRTRLAGFTIRSDPVLVERVARNLIANAVRYTDDGGVLVACRRAGAEGRVQLEVWDTGRGIAADQQALVFQEFYQARDPDEPRIQGLGLGLAIVQRIASLLDCPLSLGSRPGRGSVFRLTLPGVMGPGAAELATLEAPVARPRGGLILVVDDEAAVREGMRSLLVGWGHEVIAAASGADMLRRLEGEVTVPRLIICDYGLAGGETGLAAIRDLRASCGPVPALLVTGDTQAERLAEAQAAGVPLLHKPLSNSRLRAAIGNLILSTD